MSGGRRRFTSVTVIAGRGVDIIKIIRCRFRSTTSHRDAKKKTYPGRGAGCSAARHEDMRHDLRVPDDGCPEQRGNSVLDRSHIHAHYAGVPVRYLGGAGRVYHHQERVVSEVRLELVQRVVPEQTIGRLRSNLR